MTVSDLDAIVLIDGVDYSGYLLSLERIENLSKPGVEISLEFSSAFPHTSIDPWDELVITEQGTLTLTGFVEHIIPTREPSKILVKGRDTYKRALDWFLDENIVTSGQQTIGYWTGYFCDLCGISYSIDTTGSGSSDIVVNDEIPFGFHSVDEVLVMLAGIAQWLMYVDSAGVLHFKYIARPTVADHTLSNVFTWEYDTNDTDTRNRAMIWGLTSGSLLTDSVLYSESRDVTGVNGVRNMVYASPNIDSIAQARAVATAALDQWARLDEVLAIDLVGDPVRHAGDSAGYTHTFLPPSTYLDTITDIKTVLSDGGYNQSITAGRRTSRFPYFPVGTSGSSAIPTSGSVIFAVNGPTGYVQKVAAYGDYIYLIGNDTSSNNRSWRVEKRSATSGSLIWGRTTTESVGVPDSRGTDIIVDGNFVYVSIRRRITFLSNWTSQIYKLNMTSGSTVPLVFPNDGQVFNTQGAFPWMTQDPDNQYLYHINGGLTDTTVAYQKPDVSVVWDTGASIRNSLRYLNETYLIASTPGDVNILEKILLTDGSVDGELLQNGLGIQEIAVSGTRCYALSVIPTSGSTGTWQVTRFDVGGPTDDFITQRWTANIPTPVSYTVNPSTTFFRGITTAGTVGIIVSLGLLSTIPLSDDGSVGPAITESAIPGDAFLCNLFASNVLYSGGVKNNNWYIQGRGFHVNF